MQRRSRSAVLVAVVVLIAHSSVSFSVRSAQPALVTALSAAAILADGGSAAVLNRAAEGDRVLYSVRVVNVGDGPAYDVSLVNVLPEGFAYVSGTALGTWPSGTSTADPAIGPGPELLFDLRATLRSGDGLALTFEALLTPTVDGIGPYVDTVTVIATGEGGEPIATDASLSVPADTDSDDTSEIALLAARPALVTASHVAAVLREGGAVSPAGPIEPGDVVTYRLVVENVGRGTAYNVVIEDRLPVALSYVGGSSKASWPSGASAKDPTGSAGSSLVWSLSATLAPGDVLSLEFDALAGSALAGETFENAMKASGSDADGTPTDPDRSLESPKDTDEDDASTARLDVIMPALAVNKEVVGVERDGRSLGSVPVGMPGDVVVFRVTVRNVGNGTAYNVDFRDQLSPGLEYETTAPYDGGSYAVTSPVSAGALTVPGGGTSFTTRIDATIDGGARLVATYAARITDAAQTGVPLENVAEAEGFNGAGVEIPDANQVVGDVFDDDAEDPDADDTGIARVRVGLPILSVAKEVVDVGRDGASIGASGPVEPGDVIVYRLSIRNTGTDTAYDVGFVDLLSPGVEIETAYGTGAFTVDRPAVGVTALELVDGATDTVVVRLGASLDPGAELVATYRARVTSGTRQGAVLWSAASAFGRSADGVAISSDDRHATSAPGDARGSRIPAVEPALVVEVTVDTVERNGVRMDSAEPVCAGDIIVYRTRVSNVGQGTAYAVRLSDPLPIGLAYRGPSRAAWPEGSSAADPTHGADGTLEWPLGATLHGGEELVASFGVVVTGEATQGDTVRNTVLGRGVDGAGTPIPSDRSSEVPLDRDSDDAASVRLAVACGAAVWGMPPALQLSGSIARIVRNGITTFGCTAGIGDRVTFELVVRNTGTLSGYDVAVIDYLPPGVTYVPGTTHIRWPFGLALVDPDGASGAELRWELPISLRGGDAVTVLFDGLVEMGVSVGQIIANRAEARGFDPSGAPLASRPDSTTPGGGMLTLVIEAPGPRGKGEDEACASPQAAAADLRFRTDATFYAAAELQKLAEWIGESERIEGSDLPMCLRTAAAEAARVAFENWAEIEVGSGLGLPLFRGPGFRDAADPQAAMNERLDACARAVGLDPAARPANERWIVLEYAGGDSRFETRGAGTGPWPADEWKDYDRRITPSATGMGLLLQALEARRLLGSDLAQEQYLGCVAVETMRNKVASLSELRAVPGSPDGLFAHAYAAVWDDRRLRYTVIDSRADLLDQVALAWGLSAFIDLVFDASLPWPDTLGSLLGDAQRARQELERVLDGTNRTLCGFDGVLRESTADREGTSVRITTLGLLLAALHDVSRVIGSHPAVERLAAHAALELSRRVGPDGRLASGTSGAQIAETCAVVRGFVAASRILGVAAYGNVAARVLDSFDRDLWDAGLGVYAAPAGGGSSRTCFAALDLGLVVGALRESAPLLSSSDADRVLSRLANHVRTVTALALERKGTLGNCSTEEGETAPCGSLGPAFVLPEVQCCERCVRAGTSPQ
ncbi:MAG: hypothetical protein PHU43_08495 [Candidatus Bipolaricaulis sp.]|nr:hypothetical protein [Candidatus Bipolaricaulis sp.]